MKFAVISDIHGNLEALQSVLRDCSENGVDRIVCLGDTIGYGADSERCFELLNSQNPTPLQIMGNHEDMFLGRVGTEHCSSLGKTAALIMKTELAGRGFERRIEAFPYFFEDGRYFFTHCGYEQRADWPYLNSAESVKNAVSASKHEIMFCGHTHRYRVSSLDQSGDFTDILLPEQRIFNLDADKRYLINAGSVGQARADKTASTYVIVEGNRVEFRHIAYNAYLTYRKMLKVDRDLAVYLIREDWRRRKYERLSNRRIGIYRKTSD